MKLNTLVLSTFFGSSICLAGPGHPVSHHMLPAVDAPVVYHMSNAATTAWARGEALAHATRIANHSLKHISHHSEKMIEFLDTQIQVVDGNDTHFKIRTGISQETLTTVTYQITFSALVKNRHTKEVLRAAEPIAEEVQCDIYNLYLPRHVGGESVLRTDCHTLSINLGNLVAASSEKSE